ncbi:hypothetical protein F5Y15DRAFT_36604 [Xylariaceae sp. FL0016]|nr:hypothetical protein F5Y15DRAFT_36604 [Xylariaceae sp. FL0016]
MRFIGLLMTPAKYINLGLVIALALHWRSLNAAATAPATIQSSPAGTFNPMAKDQPVYPFSLVPSAPDVLSSDCRFLHLLVLEPHHDWTKDRKSAPRMHMVLGAVTTTTSQHIRVCAEFIRLDPC